MPCKAYIYKTIYVIIHTLFTYLECFYTVWVYLYKKLLNYRHIYLKTDEYEYVSENVKVIDKKPNHISILLGKEQPSYCDLARLTLWCIASGITFVSFYDQKGILKRSENKLQEAIEKQNLHGNHIVWYNKQHSYKNGIVGKKTFIRTLSSLDSKNSVVNVAKELSKDKNKKINQETVECSIKQKFMFPDPDLGLYCGSVLSVYGYPPWQIRVTEFISIRSHHSINSETFLYALHKYNKTEQRLGK